MIHFARVCSFVHCETEHFLVHGACLLLLFRNLANFVVQRRQTSWRVLMDECSNLTCYMSRFCAELHIIEGVPSLIFVKSSYTIEVLLCSDSLKALLCLVSIIAGGAVAGSSVLSGSQYDVCFSCRLWRRREYQLTMLHTSSHQMEAQQRHNVS